MCDTKIFLVSLSLILFVAANFWKRLASTEEKMEHQIEIRRQVPYEIQ